MNALTLTPECVLPGCHEPAILAGDACQGCRDAFGPMLVERPDLPGLTAESIEARDGKVRAAYAQQRDETKRKQNQVCWLCEERRTCALIDGRWECDGCAADRPKGSAS